jgi:hypothetical protein
MDAKCVGHTKAFRYEGALTEGDLRAAVRHVEESERRPTRIRLSSFGMRDFVAFTAPGRPVDTAIKSPAEAEKAVAFDGVIIPIEQDHTMREHAFAIDMEV